LRISASVALTTLAITATAARPAAAQLGRQTAGVNAGITYETYSFGDGEAIGIESVTLMTVPFGAGVRFGDAFGLSVRGAWASGSLSLASGDESSIDGLTDTELRASYTTGRDLVTFTAIALLPTGRDLLTADEVEVAGVVAADVLPFRISNWGTGGGFGGSVAFAVPMGAFGTGVSVGYVTTRDWEPVETSPSYVYRPGNQLHVTAAIDRSVGPTGKLGLRASLLTYDADRVDDVNLYSAGNRIEATASYAFAAGPRSSAIVWGGLHHRAAGSLEDPSANTPVSPASDILFAGALFRMPLARGVLQPGLDIRAVSGSDEAGTGYTLTAGVSAEMPAGSVTLAPSVRARFGSIEPGDGSSSGVTGIDLGMVVRFGGR
jgi:hypothetical protein